MSDKRKQWEKTIGSPTSSALLNKTNPEIFHSTPRKGYNTGVSFNESNYEPQDEQQTEDKSKMSKTTRDYRILTALEGSNWSLRGDMSADTVQAPDPLKDTKEMLTVALSTVMVLATEGQPTNTMLKWTIKYLNCIKDEFGVTPPNIRGILNHIKHLYGDLNQFDIDKNVSNTSPGQTERQTVTVTRGDPNIDEQASEKEI